MSQDHFSMYFPIIYLSGIRILSTRSQKTANIKNIKDIQSSNTFSYFPDFFRLFVKFHCRLSSIIYNDNNNIIITLEM